jgi:hypothetical protein
MNRGDVKRYIEERLPGSTVKSRMTIPCRNSRIFHMDLCQGQKLERIVVKISRNHRPQEVAMEYANLSRFYNATKPDAISSPRPLFVDEEKGMLAMSHVPGTNLAYMLHEVRPVGRDYLNHTVDLSAAALAEYHAIFRHKEGKSVTIDRAAPEDEINRLLTKNRSMIAECNLRTMVTPFFDFTPWNIIIDASPGSCDMVLYLIDFPRTDYICTPHLDLGRFRFSLELIKQFPPAKLLGINRWDVESTFDRFLCSYSQKMDVSLNADDLSLIARARDAYIRRAQDLSRKGRCGWQPKIEQAYLQTFSRAWLDQKGIFSRWPRKGQGQPEKA